MKLTAPSKMKLPAFWKTYAAAAVLLGLGAYVYFVESKKEAEPEKPREKVLALDKSKVKELTLTPATGETIHLVKEGEGWRMTAPEAVAADGSEVDSILSSLETLEVDEVVTETPEKLADFGLEKPKVTVAAQLEGGERKELQVGNKTPDEGGVYAKVPARARVFTIPAYLEGSLTKKPFDLRDRNVLHIKRDAVKTLEIRGPQGNYALARDGKGEWAFTKPLRTKAGRWTVDGLLGTLEGLRMESVAAPEAKELKTYGLDMPARTVVLSLTDGGDKVLEIGKATEDKKVYARVPPSPQVVVIPSALVDDLAKGMGELRAKRLLEVASYEVEGLEVEVEGAKKTLARSSSKDKEGLDQYKWKKTSPEPKDVETRKVEDAIFALGGVEAQEFVDAPQAPATYGLDAPTLKVTVRQAGKDPVSVEVGRKDGSYYGRRSGDDAVLKLDTAKAEEVIKSFKEL